MPPKYFTYQQKARKTPVFFSSSHGLFCSEVLTFFASREPALMGSTGRVTSTESNANPTTRAFFSTSSTKLARCYKLIVGLTTYDILSLVAGSIISSIMRGFFGRRSPLYCLVQTASFFNSTSAICVSVETKCYFYQAPVRTRITDNTYIVK